MRNLNSLQTETIEILPDLVYEDEVDENKKANDSEDADASEDNSTEKVTVVLIANVVFIREQKRLILIE